MRKTVGAEPELSAEGTDWRAFVTVGSVMMLTQIGLYLIAAALPLYLHDLGAAQGRIGLEVGLASIAGLVITFAVGPMLNHYGGKVFLALGGASYVIAAVGMLAIPNEGAVSAFRVLQGVGTAAIMPAGFTLGAKLLPERHGTALGILGALNNIALAAGPPIGLALYVDRGAGWLFWPAAVAAGIGVASVLLIPRPVMTHTAAAGFGFDRAWIPILLTNGLGVLYFGGIISYLPLVLAAAHGPNAGIFFTADALGVLLLRIPTGMLVDRRGSRLPTVLGLLLTLPGIAILALPLTIPVLVASGAATGIGAGLCITGIMANLSRLSSDGNRGTAMSLGGASFSAGMFVGASISGLLIGPGGFNAVLVFGFIACVAALPFGLRQV